MSNSQILLLLGMVCLAIGIGKAHGAEHGITVFGLGLIIWGIVQAMISYLDKR